MSKAISRLEFEDIDEELRSFLLPTVERLGYFGELFQVLAHEPRALRTFMEYSSTLRAVLPLNLNEVCALTVCSVLDARYERIQHERLSENSGLERAWIAELVGREAAGLGTSAETRLDAEEAAVRNLALALAKGKAAQSAPLMDNVVEILGLETAVAILLQITRFMGIATMLQLFDMAPPVPSIFAQPQ